MNTKYLLGIGGVAILAYVLFRNKKKVEVSDLQKEPVNVIPAVFRRTEGLVPNAFAIFCRLMSVKLCSPRSIPPT